MTTLAESWPLGLRLGPVRTLTRARRWRIGQYVIEETTDRELWLLGKDDLGQLDSLPRAMTDRDVERLRFAGVRTVDEMHKVVLGGIEMALLGDRVRDRLNRRAAALDPDR